MRRLVAALHELTGRVRALALKDLSDLTLAVPIRTARGRGASPQPLLELDEDGDVVELPAPDADAYRPITAAPNQITPTKILLQIQFIIVFPASPSPPSRRA